MRRKDLKNLEFHSNPKGCLYLQEIDALIGVVTKLMTYLSPDTFLGYFVFDGQPNLGDASKIFSFELRDGACNGSIDYVSMTNDSIDAILEKKPESLLNGINWVGEQRVLVLRTTCGRFVAGFNCKPTRVYAYIDYVLLGLALAMSKIGIGDIVLQRSVNMLMHNIPDSVKNFVDNVFDKNVLPEVVAWRVWRVNALLLPNFFS